ncbi:MAG: hypothetical protein AAGA95_17360, partial [Pseudomonadota bacterium]
LQKNPAAGPGKFQRSEMRTLSRTARETEIACIAHRFGDPTPFGSSIASRNAYLVSRRILHVAANFPPATHYLSLTLAGNSKYR